MNKEAGMLIGTLIGSRKSIISSVFLYSVFLQLMDDDIVSLTGLTMLAYPLCMGKMQT